MKIYVIRHGETDYNVRRLFQGQINTDLNDTGRAQARAAAEKIRAMGLTFDRVYSSPLQRAVETVEIITGKDSSEIQTDDRLLEMNFGALEGQPFDRDSRACGSLFQDPPSLTESAAFLRSLQRSARGRACSSAVTAARCGHSLSFFRILI